MEADGISLIQEVQKLEASKERNGKPSNIHHHLHEIKFFNLMNNSIIG
jgi:hypothetical protein